ncbi:MAG TPA: hypothetical protein VGN12_21635 [Pirellulales bacterium]|jgi:hypothetical protein
MIALARQFSRIARRTSIEKDQRSNCTEQFLLLLPAIRRHAQIRFQFLDEENREEMIAAVVAHAWSFFMKLASMGREKLAFAGPLARYGIARILDGRQVGSQANVHDISSKWCQLRKGVCVDALVQRDPTNGEWQEILVEDRKALPSDLAAMRIDFREWLKTLARRERLAAEYLAAGEKTQAVARMLQVSNGRISQIRAELERAWLRFQGEVDETRV